MGSSASDGVWLLLVALMWGATNPLLKRHSKGVETVKKSSKVSQFWAEFTCLFLNWKYLLSFITNQMGSVLYYITLASSDLTLTVPVANSLTFIFTALTSHLLGEKSITKEALIGMCFVVCGASLCVLSEAKHTDTTVVQGTETVNYSS